jgi:hypothetical protein
MAPAHAAANRQRAMAGVLEDCTPNPTLQRTNIPLSTTGRVVGAASQSERRQMAKTVMETRERAGTCHRRLFVLMFR